MKNILHVFGILLSLTALANSLFFEGLETHFKSNEYIEYSFDYKKTGLFFGESGSGTLLLRKNGDFLLEVPYGKNSKYTVKYENEMFFELTSQNDKHTYTVYNDPANLQIGFAVDALKQFSKGVMPALNALKKDFNVVVTHNEAKIKAKNQNEALQSLVIQSESENVNFIFIIKPEADSERTENIEIQAKVLSKTPINAALRFILKVPSGSRFTAFEEKFD